MEPVWQRQWKKTEDLPGNFLREKVFLAFEDQLGSDGSTRHQAKTSTFGAFGHFESLTFADARRDDPMIFDFLVTVFLSRDFDDNGGNVFLRILSGIFHD
jgi:hypothetical protein